MVCQKLLTSNKPIARVNLSNYKKLHPDGQRLISGWFRRAWQSRDCQPEDCFEPFIFAWFAVNGWAACVTERDSDREYLDAIILDRDLSQRFEDLLSDVDSDFTSYARKFSSFWPIFKVQAIRRRGLERKQSGSRDEIINRYIKAGVQQFAPQCWKLHEESGNNVPLDWPHTIAAIYRVRCNLFHGDKAAHSEMDQQIVLSAFNVLIRFFDKNL